MKRTDIDPDTERAARSFVERVSQVFDASSILLFGSRARDDHRNDSDADVAVILRGPPGRFVDTKLALADIAYDVLLETGIRVQPLPVWEDEWNHPDAYPNPALLESIRRDGIPL